MPRGKQLPKVQPSKVENSLPVLFDPETTKALTQLIGLLLIKVAVDYIREHKDVMDQLSSDQEADHAE